MENKKVEIKVATQSATSALARVFLDPAVMMWTASAVAIAIPEAAPLLMRSYWNWVGLVWSARVVCATLGKIFHS